MSFMLFGYATASYSFKSLIACSFFVTVLKATSIPLSPPLLCIGIYGHEKNTYIYNIRDLIFSIKSDQEFCIASSGQSHLPLLRA